LTFGANGSFVVSASKDWNAHGTWWKTGDGELTAVTVAFIEHEGEVSYTTVVTYVSQFDEDCRTQTFDKHIAVHNLPADPAQPLFPPQGAPLLELDSRHTATKITW
jgi:hypothetical protein